MTGIWSISVALVALGRRFGRADASRFAVRELLVWAPDLQRESTAHRVCALMAKVGWLTPAPATPDNPRANQLPGRPAFWQLTAVGLEAATTATAEATNLARAAQMTARNKARKHPNSLGQRLWAVLRTRRTLTSIEAVELLADAGDDTESLRGQIVRYLTLWSQLAPDMVQVSTRRVGRCRRFVLVGDAACELPEVFRAAEHRARDGAVAQKAQQLRKLAQQEAAL